MPSVLQFNGNWFLYRRVKQSFRERLRRLAKRRVREAAAAAVF